MIAQFAGQNQRNWDEKWPEIMLAVNSSTSESTGYSPCFLTQAREPRLPSALYDRETIGTGKQTETPEDKANKMKEIFEIVRRNMEKAAQDQARHYNLRRRQWNPTIGDTVWAKEHHLSKAAEGFAAKLAPRYDGPYTVIDFVSPVICKIRHKDTQKERTVHVSELKQQTQELEQQRRNLQQAQLRIEQRESQARQKQELALATGVPQERPSLDWVNNMSRSVRSGTISRVDMAHIIRFQPEYIRGLL
ncbi:uncharacterized protein LOC128261178 [Drosophila gunungcola]|uniref:uncharacterized protein LOC128261178 n=1 Tax=Drosophila gunungcola TaxID=103775 RepID=UPI0022E5929B|nr:uncharacterized protein LOC128261178 [Drosophila gunungcola]